jgi:hypothetical protein
MAWKGSTALLYEHAVENRRKRSKFVEKFGKMYRNGQNLYRNRQKMYGNVGKFWKNFNSILDARY